MADAMVAKTFPLRPRFLGLGCLTTWWCERLCGRSCAALSQPGALDLPAKRRGAPRTISKAVPGSFNTFPTVPGVQSTPMKIGGWGICVDLRGLPGIGPMEIAPKSAGQSCMSPTGVAPQVWPHRCGLTGVAHDNAKACVGAIAGPWPCPSPGVARLQGKLVWYARMCGTL
eukprot:364811-Chlamydomonas_euryale.AAC.8